MGMAVVVSWLRFYKKFPKAERHIFGLEFAYDLVGKNYIDTLIDSLTDEMNYKLPTAAKIVNVQEGFSSILVIFTSHISNAYLGIFKTIVLANVFYLIGLVLFIIAAYLYGEGEGTDEKLLCVALFFLAVGISGRDFLLESFLSDQHLRPSDPTINVEDNDNEAVSWKWKPYLMLLLSAVLSLLAVRAIRISDKVLVALLVSLAFAGLSWFLFGHSTYRKRPRTGGPLATIFRVFKAAILRRQLEYPTKPTQIFYEKEEASNDLVLLPSIPFFRWLDRAAIPESSSSIGPEEPKIKDRLICTATEVKEVKRLLTMVPMWASFLVYSVIEAAGSTFFFEQSKSTDNNFSLVIFVICKDLASLIASDMGKIIIPKLQFFKTRQTLATLVRIGIGMLCSLFCCIAAWRVEKFSFSDNMNVFWLTPQFLLLGCMEGFSEKGVSDFFKTQVSGSMRDYGPAFSEFILGIGKFISAILVVIFKDWFGEDVESSRLDRYYEALALLGLLNFFLYVSIAVWYGNQQAEVENLLPISVMLPNKSYSFPPQGSPLPKVQRFFTSTAYEKLL